MSQDTEQESRTRVVTVTAQIAFSGVETEAAVRITDVATRSVRAALDATFGPDAAVVVGSLDSGRS